MIRNVKLLIVLCILFASCSKTDVKIYKQKNAPIDERVNDLLSRMTLEGKVSQMRMFHAQLGINLDENDSLVLSENVKARLTNGIAGIKNPGEHDTPEKAASLNNKLQKYVIDHNRLGIPAFFVTESYNGVDAEGCTRFGRPISLSSSWDTALVKKVYDAMGREARLRGLHLTHSPEADVSRDPRFGRMSETFGEDTYLVTRMIVNAVSGLQGDMKEIQTHIGAVTKHFAGYAQVSGGTNFASIEISPRTLIDEILPPFKAAVKEANTLGIMACHGDLNGIASHANPWLLTDVLRNQWGFKGYVVSDANDIARLYSFMKVAETPDDAVKLALKAGVDVDLYSDKAYALLPEMARKDPSLVKYIDRSVKHVLRTKFILGLFDDPYTDVTQAKNMTRDDQSIALAEEADQESIILLKNHENVLPLSNVAKAKVALVGPLLSEDTKTDFERVVNNKIQFLDKKGFSLTNGARGIPKLTDKKENEKGIQQILKMAKQADVVVAFLGGDEFTSKEAFFNGALGDRDKIDPVGQQDELLLELKKLGKPVIVVLKHRRTLSINTIAEKADAILDCWDLSEFGDQAIAKTIFGQVVPSGKLPVTVPRSIGQIPFYYSQKAINYKKGYLFTKNSPLFPFGFGLSYSTFEYSNFHLSDTIPSLNSNVIASIDVKNTGDRKAKEVVELYLKDPVASVTRPERELKGFEKIELAPGETKIVEFTITPQMMSFTGIDMKKKIEPGLFEVFVGSSSATQRKLSYRLVGN